MLHGCFLVTSTLFSLKKTNTTGSQFPPMKPLTSRIVRTAAFEHFGSTLPNTPRVHHSGVGATAAVTPPNRQYLTRSKATALPCLGPQRKSKALAVDFQIKVGFWYSIWFCFPYTKPRSIPHVVIPTSGAGLSTVREEDGSLVANGSTSLDGFLVEGCSDEEDLEEEKLDFTFSEEKYKSSPSSPAPATPVIPTSLKGASVDPSKTEKAGQSHSTPPASGRWRYMFSSNHNISTCSKLMHFSTYNNIHSCSFLAEDLDHTSDDCKLYVMGYVSGKFPGYRALNDIIGNT
ncbi:hypothetical protein NC651_033814 [Populus alba x Populus x berolinensis]|nr:hypothetical protein NC651_033814 [Populus alba x Populus x berolinensis]